MQRTVALRLGPSPAQRSALLALRAEYARACNLVVPFAVENRCWNRVALHHLAYYRVREATALGSQMVCNALRQVADAYRVLKIGKDDDVPTLRFRDTGSVHFDKRTYSLKGETVSLYTLGGRVVVPLVLGDFQRRYLETGTPKEAELVCRKGRWYFHLVLDLPDAVPVATSGVLGVDLGENVVAATSSGTLFGGGALRHHRDRYLALRGRLQSNGSRSAKRRLRHVSGRESRHVTHVNHCVSKAIVAEAVRSGAGVVALEDLTHIRKRIRAGKRVRSRLHRWAWRQLQDFVEYKAHAAGLSVLYVCPAYTSQTCSDCGSLGQRTKHRFRCSTCGSQQHSDTNGARNLCGLALSAVSATGAVSHPHGSAA